MKILYIHQYFATPYEPGGTRSYWFSKELINRGHTVIMITATNEFHTTAEKVNIDGINVTYVQNEYSNYFTPFQRIKSFIRFMWLSIKEASKEKDIDIVYATSTPLTIGIIALWLKLRKRWKYIFEVRDLWPEFPIEVGAIKNRLVIWLLRRLERRIYSKAEFIIALSPGMMDGVLKAGTPQNKVCVIPNMSKPDIFYPHEPSTSIINEFNIDMHKFNVIHFGSMGIANGLEYIIDAADIASKQGLNDINFIFLGDGATLPKLQQKTESCHLHNIQFLGNYKMDIVAEIVNCCDISITCFLNLPILYTNSPNKLFDSLSAGKPIIVNSAGWTKDLVEKEKCGCYVDPTNPQDLIHTISTIKDNKALLSEWGKNARRLSETTFDKSILSKQMADIVEKYGVQ